MTKFFNFLGLFILVLATHAQDSSKILLADGTKPIFANTARLEAERKAIREAIEVTKVRLPNPVAESPECGETDFVIKQAAEGFFVTKEFKSEAYLYLGCDKKTNRLYIGLIVLQKMHKVLAHYAYPYQSDEKIDTVSDLNGDSLDELVIFSYPVINDAKVRITARIIEILPNEIKKLGEFEIHQADSIDSSNKNFNYLAAKIYAEKKADNKPIFFAEKVKLDNVPLQIIYDENKLKANGKFWQQTQSIQQISPNEDTTNYSASSWRFGVTDIASWILAVFTALFVLLIPATAYAYYFTGYFREVKEKPNKKRENSAGTETEKIEPELPKLDPLNCPNCGAGVPLRDEKMSCPNCSTAFPVPREYEELRLFRNQTAARLKQATNYWNWATFLTSGWILWAFFICIIALIVSLSVIFFVGTSGSYWYYTIFYMTKTFGVAVLAGLFWIFTLFLMLPVGWTSVRKDLPTLEKAENLGTEENARCSQCGGAIRFARSDIAAVCGYCGIETYRTKLVWEMRNLTNEIKQKASFSLIKAVEAYNTAIFNLVGTPLAVMFVALIPAVLCLVSSLFR